VWLLDPRDAQYLNSTVEELRRAAATLVSEGLLRSADEEYGAATAKLMERREAYLAQLAWMLEFIRPSFNEEMRHGSTNM
jgi:DNA-binding ferritin-like protein